MTPKVTITFVVGLTKFMTLKGHGVIRGHRDLLYDLKGYGDHCRRFDLVYDPKGHSVIRGRRDLLYDPKGHDDLCGWFDLVHDPKRSSGHERPP